MVQDKGYPYMLSAAAARTSLRGAIQSALPNSDVVDEAQLVNRTKRPMRVSKLSACRSFERGWGNKSKGVRCQWATQVHYVAAHNKDQREWPLRRGIYTATQAKVSHVF